MRVTLTNAQIEAVDLTVEAIRGGAKERAIRGLAGTGKSALIPELRDSFRRLRMRVAVGAPTHRGVKALRFKGVAEAKTIYSLALAPIFDDEWTEALEWLRNGGEHPYLLSGFSSDQLHAVADLDPAGALATLGLRAWEHVIGWAPRRDVADIGIIDEASMIGRSTLELCREAFGRLVLVGDHGQLPPVNDTPVLASVPGVELHEIHRQKDGSGILRQAARARAGKLPVPDDGVILAETINPEALCDAPLIVWTNNSRLRVTEAVRTALGKPAYGIDVGETLICRNTKAKLTAAGWLNNSLWTVVGVRGDRILDLCGEEGEMEQNVRVGIEELGEADGIPFRFAYVVTAHNAQGGEWPCVHVSMPDARAFYRYRPDDAARWMYTALTRGRERIVMVARHVIGRGARMTPCKRRAIC